MSKKSDPPKVDKKAYADLLAQSTAAAQAASENSAAQLAWAQETYAQDRALAQPIIEAALTRMGNQDAWAAADRERREPFTQVHDERAINLGRARRTQSLRQAGLDPAGLRVLRQQGKQGGHVLHLATHGHVRGSKAVSRSRPPSRRSRSDRQPEPGL